MRRQLVPGLVVCLTVIKAKTRPGIEATLHCDREQSKLASIPGRSQLRKTAWYTLSAHASIAPLSKLVSIILLYILQ